MNEDLIRSIFQILTLNQQDLKVDESFLERLESTWRGLLEETCVNEEDFFPLVESDINRKVVLKSSLQNKLGFFRFYDNSQLDKNSKLKKKFSWKHGDPECLGPFMKKLSQIRNSKGKSIESNLDVSCSTKTIGRTIQILSLEVDGRNKFRTQRSSESNKRRKKNNSAQSIRSLPEPTEAYFVYDYDSDLNESARGIVTGKQVASVDSCSDLESLDEGMFWPLPEEYARHNMMFALEELTLIREKYTRNQNIIWLNCPSALLSIASENKICFLHNLTIVFQSDKHTNVLDSETAEEVIAKSKGSLQSIKDV